MMDYLPPGFVVKVGDPRWRRWAIRDGTAQWWAGERRRWSDKPAEAVLFCREIDAIEATGTATALGDAGGHVRRHGLDSDFMPAAGRARNLPPT